MEHVKFTKKGNQYIIDAKDFDSHMEKRNTFLFRLYIKFNTSMYIYHINDFVNSVVGNCISLCLPKKSKQYIITLSDTLDTTKNIYSYGDSEITVSNMNVDLLDFLYENDFFYNMFNDEYIYSEHFVTNFINDAVDYFKSIPVNTVTKNDNKIVRLSKINNLRNKVIRTNTDIEEGLINEIFDVKVEDKYYLELDEDDKKSVFSDSFQLFVRNYEEDIERINGRIMGSTPAFLINNSISAPNDVDLWLYRKDRFQKIETKFLGKEWYQTSQYRPVGTNISPNILQVETYKSEMYPFTLQIIYIDIEYDDMLKQFDLDVAKGMWTPSKGIGATNDIIRQNILSKTATFNPRPWDFQTGDDGVLTLTYRSISRLIKYKNKGFKIVGGSVYTTKQLDEFMNSVYKKDCEYSKSIINECIVHREGFYMYDDIENNDYDTFSFIFTLPSIAYGGGYPGIISKTLNMLFKLSKKSHGYNFPFKPKNIYDFINKTKVSNSSSSAAAA